MKVNVYLLQVLYKYYLKDVKCVTYLFDAICYNVFTIHFANALKHLYSLS